MSFDESLKNLMYKLRQLLEPLKELSINFDIAFLAFYQLVILKEKFVKVELKVTFENGYTDINTCYLNGYKP